MIRTTTTACALVCSATAFAGSAPLPSPAFTTFLIDDFLIVAMGPQNDFGGQPGVGTAFNMNNFELGANKAPVPSTSDFLNSGGGPGLAGNVPNIPLNALPVGTGVFGNGNVAITSGDGAYNLQDVGVYADRGILTAGSRNTTGNGGSDEGTSNSFFNDPNMFPNTFVSSGFSNPGSNNNIGGTGTLVNPNDAVQSTRIDANNFAGVTGSVNFDPLLNELAAARSDINALSPTRTLSFNDGKFDTELITLDAGFNVIDIDTNGNDLLLENQNLVIDGPEGAKVVFRIDDDANFNISNGNILVGTSGIDLNSVLFYTDKDDNGTHFNFSNTVINGAAFWTVANSGGEINIDNAQGCTQLLGDKVNLNDVRFGRCHFENPAPGAAGVFGIAGLFLSRRRR